MESIEVQMARIQEQMKSLISELERSNRGREHTDSQIDKLSESMSKLHIRMEKVEEQLTSNAPVIQEFITIKQKVTGAGVAGKWVWAGCATAITLIATFREQIRAYFLG